MASLTSGRATENIQSLDRLWKLLGPESESVGAGGNLFSLRSLTERLDAVIVSSAGWGLAVAGLSRVECLN